MSVWLVRTGNDGEQEHTALEKGVVPDLSTIQSRKSLAEPYRKMYPDASNGHVVNQVGQLWAFCSRIQVGDLAVLLLNTRSVNAKGIGLSPSYSRSSRCVRRRSARK
jgi:predicted Mrr-cat superfamily restriction endonuclease